jgi:ABC-type glutathione transport system ATPase component
VNGVHEGRADVAEGLPGPARVAALLERVGPDPPVGDRRPHELSGGRCRRAGIARAPACEPRLLVLDEPVRAGVLDPLAGLREDLGLGRLSVRHDRAVPGHVADRVAEMRDGRVTGRWRPRSPAAAPR